MGLEGETPWQMCGVVVSLRVAATGLVSERFPVRRIVGADSGCIP
ncbi:hypothetical protein FH063_002024 [Azospirillum argentinense]|uniref:Uncharacterized protein n=1 Tax=Azospirillum argentinense TaxID=2970906 RepID=A0A5B0KND5_9PROT|nr:hypothetical protein [Azospirillum argentinense]KAA1054122.1 hypothetical protein FH063_002024 [Azospirillum argentinense]